MSSICKCKSPDDLHPAGQQTDVEEWQALIEQGKRQEPGTRARTRASVEASVFGAHLLLILSSVSFGSYVAGW